MTQDGKKHHDMSIEEILKSIKGVINNHDGVLKNNEDDILELTDIIEDNPDINDGSKTIKAVQNNGLEASMLSEETILKTSEILKHFSKAAKTIHASHPNNKTDTLEEIVIKMLRPEISKWLEANLPLLVKQLVEIEIQKLKPHD